MQSCDGGVAGGGATARAATRDLGKKRLGSGPIGGGGESPLRQPALGYRNDSSRSRGSDQPAACIVSTRADESFFRGVEPRRPQRARLRVGVGIGAKSQPYRRRVARRTVSSPDEPRLQRSLVTGVRDAHRAGSSAGHRVSISPHPRVGRGRSRARYGTTTLRRVSPPSTPTIICGP
jgi:hypothetical protein